MANFTSIIENPLKNVSLSHLIIHAYQQNPYRATYSSSWYKLDEKEKKYVFEKLIAICDDEWLQNWSWKKCFIPMSKNTVTDGERHNCQINLLLLLKYFILPFVLEMWVMLIPLVLLCNSNKQKTHRCYQWALAVHTSMLYFFTQSNHLMCCAYKEIRNLFIEIPYMSNIIIFLI